MKTFLIFAFLLSSAIASSPHEDYSSAESTPIMKLPKFTFTIQTGYKEIVDIGYIDVKIPKGSVEYQKSIAAQYKIDMINFVFPSMTDFYALGIDKKEIKEIMRLEAASCFNTVERLLMIKFRHIKDVSQSQPETYLRFIFTKAD